MPSEPCYCLANGATTLCKSCPRFVGGAAPSAPTTTNSTTNNQEKVMPTEGAPVRAIPQMEVDVKLNGYTWDDIRRQVAMLVIDFERDRTGMAYSTGDDRGGRFVSVPRPQESDHGD
jgi:hypothetical protein